MQRNQVRVVFDPAPQPEPQLDRFLEARERFVVLTLHGVKAADVVEQAGILRIDRERPFRPLEPALPLPDVRQFDGTETQRPGIVRVPVASGM